MAGSHNGRTNRNSSRLAIQAHQPTEPTLQNLKQSQTKGGPDLRRIPSDGLSRSGGVKEGANGDPRGDTARRFIKFACCREISDESQRFRIAVKGRGGQPQRQNEPEFISSGNPSTPTDGTHTSKPQTKSNKGWPRSSRPARCAANRWHGARCATSTRGLPRCATRLRTGDTPGLGPLVGVRSMSIGRSDGSSPATLIRECPEGEASG